MKKTILAILALVFAYQISVAQEFNATFSSLSISAELHDPFIGRRQELYSVIDSQNRTHIAWIKDNRNSRIMMYSIVDGNTVSHFTVDSDSLVNMQKKHPVLVLDNNEKPHIAWFVKRDPTLSCCPSGNFAVMYAGDADGNGIFNISQVSTNPENSEDNTATEYTDSYVNHMPSIMISESGNVEVAYVSNTYQSISYENYLVIARKNTEGGGWQYEEALILDDLNIYGQDGVFFPPKVSDTYYGLVFDISPHDIELVTNASGEWTKTSITNNSVYTGNPADDISHPQIITDSQGNYHVFYFYNNRDLDKNIVKHLTLDGSSVASIETIELDEYTPTNYVYAAIDQTTDDIYFAYTGFDSGYNEYLVYFEEGVKKEIFLRETGSDMSYHSLNANNGFVSFVTADESKDSMYVTTNLEVNATTEFDDNYNGSVTQDGVHIGTYTFEVTGNALSGSYYGDNETIDLNGTVNNQGKLNISLAVNGATISVSGTIASQEISGSWSSSIGESGTIFGSTAIDTFDGDYTGSAESGNTEIGTFSISILNGLITGSYSGDGESIPINGYVEPNGDISFNIIFEDESISTIKASISSSEITGTFSNSVEGSGTISGSKAGTVSIEGPDSFPTTFSLSQNYPNPFNPSSSISFGIPEATFVTLDVYNMLGQIVKSLVNERKSAGFHTVSFDATHLSSGLYIYKIQAGEYISAKKMTLIK